LIENELVYSNVIVEKAIEVREIITSIKNETCESPISFKQNDNNEYRQTGENVLNKFLKLVLIIFLNNALLNTIYIIPIVGTIVYVNTLINTSLISKYISMQYRRNWFRHILETVLLSPHTYLELLAYSITITESIWITVLYMKSLVKKNWVDEFKTIDYSIVSIGLSYVILLIASLIESMTIIQ